MLRKGTDWTSPVDPNFEQHGDLNPGPSDRRTPRVNHPTKKTNQIDLGDLGSDLGRGLQCEVGVKTGSDAKSKPVPNCRIDLSTRSLDPAAVELDGTRSGKAFDITAPVV